jgi:YidC/Oxa1 family membrane protein insertase
MDNRRLLLLLIVFSFSLVMLWDAWQKYSQPKAILPAAVVCSGARATAFGEPARAAAGSTQRPWQALTTVEKPSRSEDRSVCRRDRQARRRSRSPRVQRLQGQQEQSQGLCPLRGQAPVSCPEWSDRREPAEPQNLFSPLPATGTGRRCKDRELRLEAPVSNGIKVAKIYTFTRGSYLIDVTHEIDNGSEKEVAAHVPTTSCSATFNAPEGESSMVSTFTGPAVYTDQEKFQKVDFADIEKGKAKFANKADNGWIAMVQHYFVAAWIPEPGLPREFYMRKLESSASPVVSAGVIVPAPTRRAGLQGGVFGPDLCRSPDSAHSRATGQTEGRRRHRCAGSAAGRRLRLADDHCRADLLVSGSDLQGGRQLGLGDRLLTVGIKLLFFPLSAASYKSMAKMKPSRRA